ncbi:MAG: type II toxin-antitoxin system RelE family toxin [Deltaproteobacteria bacterium]
MKKVTMSESKRVEESEELLVSRAQEALSHCRWVVGECAARWTERYARGRTDGDFAALIGLTGDQVYQRRRVWETFGGVRDEFPSLKWSHFYSALSWDDAHDCLRWAEETRSTVAEMRAWRRARRGEDLSVEAPDDEAIRFLPGEPEFVHIPGEPGRGQPRSEARAGAGTADDERAVLAGVARQGGAGGEDYTPFRPGAVTPPPREVPAETGTATAEPPSTEQLAKRLAATLERFVRLMTPQFRREFRKLPEPVRERFHKSVEELTAHVAELS